MEDLLPYYERELAFLRRYSREFATRYPKIANRLLLSGEVSEDPHVERLIEAFALLSARASKKADDDYPEFTDALLEVLYPHYLRPFPSCSIAHFDLRGKISELNVPLHYARGTQLFSRAVGKVRCIFRTAYAVDLLPVSLTSAVFQPIAMAPLAVTLPQGTGGQISLTFDLMSEQMSFPELEADKLRLFVDGEASFCAALRDALALQIKSAYVETDDSGRWQALEAIPVQQTGFAEDEFLIDYPSRTPPAYRLLTELFAYPEKFSFFDLQLAPLIKRAEKRFTLHLILKALPPDLPANRLLEGLNPDNLLMGCTPVVNLFETRGDPIMLTHRHASYPVVVEGRNAYAYEVHSIDSVTRITETSRGEEIHEFRPFYALGHGENPEQTGHYWMVRRDEHVAQISPGYETELSFIDLDGDPSIPKAETISLKLSCSNRDLPAHLAYGVKGGDLNFTDGSETAIVSLLRKPTRSLRFRRGRGAHWRLMSHLTLNHLSLTDSGVSAFKEMLLLYDRGANQVTRRQIEGIIGLEHKPCTTWLHGKHFPSIVRGIEVRISIDETSFVGTGIATFANVLDRFFGLYVHPNSFTRLVLISQHNEEILVTCPPRSGAAILV